MFSTFFKRVFADTSDEEVMKQPSSGRKYELTIIRFTPDPMPTTNTFCSGNAALTWLAVPTDTDCFIEASVRHDDRSLGDFCLWCSGEYAVARIGEHREHNASHPDKAFATGKTITFKDDDGSLYTPPSELVLPRKLAIDALRAWLIDLRHPSFLHWS